MPAGSKLVRSWFEAGSKLWTSLEPASNQLGTSFEPASVMEFGFNSKSTYPTKSVRVAHYHPVKPLAVNVRITLVDIVAHSFVLTYL